MGKVVVTDVDIHADVVIVGAGAGGATLGAELAEAGAGVAFIEAGKDLDITYGSPSHFAASQEFYDCAVRDNLLWHEEFEGRPWRTDMGECAGGGTTTYGGVLEESVPQDYATWPITYEQLVPYFTLAKSRYHVHRWPNFHLSDYAKAMRTASGKQLSAIQSAFNKVAYTDAYGVYHDHCRQCRFCMLGCMFNAKATALTIALPKARYYGAYVEDMSLATRINYIGRKISSITYIKRTPIGPGMETILHKTAYADKFILAAGTMMTPMILYWSGIAGNPMCNSSGQVGKNLRGHFFRVTFGILARDDIKTYQGNLVELNDLYQNYNNGYMLEFNMVAPPSYMGGIFEILEKTDAMNMLGVNTKRLMRKYGKIAMSAPLARADNASPTSNCIKQHSYKLNKYALPLPQVVLEPNAQESAWVVAGVNDAKTILTAAGCPTNEQYTGRVDVVHKTGTCRMGTSASNSVVDVNGKCWDMDNLWIADASIFPTSPLSNCCLTIYALGYKIADGMLNRATPPA